MDQKPPESLGEYIAQYRDHTRFQRLVTIAEKRDDLREEAIRMLLEMSKKEKKVW